MSAFVENINAAGRAFVDFALPMLVQSSLLIVILLALDVVLRRRVRAVFRYWIWMLLLVKLVLPPSLWSPVSLGTWLGDELEVSMTALLEPESPPAGPAPSATPPAPATSVPFPLVPPTVDVMAQQPSAPAPAAPMKASPQPAVRPPAPAVLPPGPVLTWQGFALLAWGVTVAALLLLLLQRAFFVRGLVAQAEEANRGMVDALADCRARLAVRRPVAVRLSPNAASPAVCGLWRPVILIPQSLAARLHGTDLEAVLLHELAHVQRGDLWVNLAQTLLQIAYFFHPLLWLANAVIRRAREQAVDETVLVALGDTAPRYPETLVNIAKLAFRRRPALSLRLIGVVESKSALTARIKHILSRPIPKSAKLGLLGLLIVTVTAGVLLPMAAAAEEKASVEASGPLDIRLVGVRPDGGDELYDAEGKKLEVTLPPLGLGGSGWKSDEQKRDFLFQVPAVQDQLLFPQILYLDPTGSHYRYGALVSVSNPGNAPSMVVVSAEFPRTYRTAWAGFFPHTVHVRKVDLTLPYFYGPRREAVCTFTGPFTVGQVIQAEEGRPYQLTPKPFDAPTESWIKFHFTTNQSFEHNAPVLLYDKQGRRHLLRGGGGGRISPQGTDLTYEVDAIPWDQIAVITMGEKLHEIVFRNIVVEYRKRPPRTYPAYWDQMAERLGLTGLSAEELNRRGFKSVQETIDVLDISRSYEQMRKAVEVIGRSLDRPNPVRLDEAARDKMRRAAASWLESPNVWVRGYGVELGLMAGFPEFVEPAFALLEYRRPTDAHRTDSIQASVLGGLRRYRDRMTIEDIQRMKRLARRCDNGRLWSRLFSACLDTSHRAEVSDVLWELAQDDRAWLWWPALAELRERHDERLKPYEGLPEPIRVRLALVGPTPLPGEDALRPQVRALLPGLFTVDNIRMYPQLWWGLHTALTTYFDRREATALYMDFLRAAAQPDTRWQFEAEYGMRSILYDAVSALLRDVNAWYGVNLGQLGVTQSGTVRESISLPRAFTQATTEALDWYAKNPQQQPRAPALEGQVVDTSRRGIEGAAVTLSRWWDSVDESGQQHQQRAPVGTVRTGADGRFVFRDLANTGHHWLEVAAVGFCQGESFPVQRLPDGQFHLQQSPQDNVIVLERPARLSGRIIGLDGQPLANAAVQVVHHPPDRYFYQDLARTDAEGHFTAGSLISGSYLVLYREGGQHARKGEYESVKAFQLVPVQEGQTVEDVVLDLRDSTCSLEFEIVDGDGQPIAADSVFLEVPLPSDRRFFAGIAGGHGIPAQRMHRLDNLPPMDGFLRVYVAGQGPERVPVQLRPNQTTRCRVKFDRTALDRAPVLAVDEPRPARFAATLPNGATVELLGACQRPRTDKSWWRPDGSPLAEAPYDRHSASAWVTPNDPNKIAFELALRVRGLPEGWEADVRSPGNAFGNTGNPPYKAGQPLPDLRWLMLEAEPNQTTCMMRCDLIGPWQTIARRAPQDPAPASEPWAFSDIIEVGGVGVSVTVTDRVGDRRYDHLYADKPLQRVVALLKNGKTEESPFGRLYSFAAVGTATVYFPRVSLIRIQEFQFQTRPLMWVEFTNVSLRPGGKTEVKTHVDSLDTVPLTVAPAAGPTSADSDGDGLSDFQEVHKYLTDPAQKDSDGDGTPDGDWNERREYAYSVRTVLRYMPPFDEDGLNDDFQDARVLKQTGQCIEVEVIHYPLATASESIPENRNWRQDDARDARLAEYLAPGVTTNWDEPMRKDLLAALKADGIDIETLTDKQVVEQVSAWLLRRSRSLDKVFTTYYVDFPEGRPRVYPGLESNFQHEFERDSANYDWTIDQHFDHELLGKGMFYNKTHGSCTSTAVYLTTVLRALGIPTRMILVTPAVDASDDKQIIMVNRALTHHRVRETMLAGLRRSRSGWTNHTFNEVYVGNRWCRLDYSRLGCPILGVERFGLQTHLYTFRDLSDVNFAPTWGRRYAKGWRDEFFGYDNPYSAVDVSDLFGAHANIPNPPFTAQDLHLSSNPRPNIFVLCPARALLWDAVFEVAKDRVWDRWGRAHGKEFYDNIFEGVWTTKPGDILVLLFSLDSSERIPAGYEDLLPQPWPEIEAQLKQGQTVELSGKARDKNVILLAAPEADGLKPLVQNSKLLQALGGAGPAPSVGPTPPPAVLQPAGQHVKLADGAAVELLGVCEHPSEGKPWWRPDGTPLEQAPYRTTGATETPKAGLRWYEFALRLAAPDDAHVRWVVADGAYGSDSGPPMGQDGERCRDLRAYKATQPESKETTEIRVGVATGAWQTRVAHTTLDREGSYTLDEGRAIAFGVAYEKDSSTYLPVTTNFTGDQFDYEVLAVDNEGTTHHVGGSRGSGHVLMSLTCRFDLALERVKEFRFQTRPWTWADFKNVALRPGLKTAEPARAESGETRARPAPGTGKVLAIGPACQALEDAVGGRYGGSVGGLSTDENRCAEYFKKVLTWTRPGDTFVLLIAFDDPPAVPVAYQDLLPLPWSEIETRVRKGETLEARGTARDLNVVFLATPTLEQLKSLIRRTHLLDPFRTHAPEEGRTLANDQSVGAEGTVPEQLQFGPPVERVLGRDALYINLEQGTTPSPPSDLGPGNKTQALLQWCRSNGIDAIADPATGSLNCLDVQVVALDPDAWMSLSVEGLRQAVERGPRLTSAPPVDGLPVVSLQGAGRPAPTYGLRTRIGTLGLLQIVDAANPQDGGLAFVKIRYKLALAATAEHAAPGQRELWLGSRQYLDLDTGQFVAIAPEEASDPNILMSRGVDLYLTREPVIANQPPMPEIQSLQLQFAAAPLRLYLQEIPVDKVRESLHAAVRRLDRPKPVTFYAGGNTYAFRTMEGTAGVFRVIWPSSMDEPRCTIQYRLIPELDIPSAAFPWGPAGDGRQCRLRAPKRAWRAGETVTLSLDLRNQGGKALHFVRVAQAQCELEVDGARYGWAELLIINAPLWTLEPGTELDDALDIKLTDSWALPADGAPRMPRPGIASQWGRRLQLAPGPHTVRVRFHASDSLLSPSAQGPSAVSNPVEITVLPSEESPAGGALVEPGRPDTAAPLPAATGPRPAGSGCTLS